MQFEWDEAKRQANLRKHGIDFADVPAAFDGAILTVLDDRVDYGETRYVSIGVLQGRPIVIAHTESENVIRLISARKATRYEQAGYFAQIAD